MGVTTNIMIGARPKHIPDSEYPLPCQRDPGSVRKEIDPQQGIGLYHLWVQDIY